MKTIEYNVSFEKMISRLPGLFAYLESDEFGNVSLHKATESVDGCWGKIVENIKLPSGVSLTVEGDEILKGDEIYTFRTIIDYYYQYKNELEENDNFRQFIERGIGKIEVDFEGKTKLTPKFLFLSNVKNLYNELVKMKKLCEFYQNNLENNLTEKDKHLCCLCGKYEQMGGDAFMNYVFSLISKAETIAEEYYGYASAAQEVKPMTLDFDIDLLSTYQDYGIMSVYAPQWIPYKDYKEGEIVEYKEELYRCNETHSSSDCWDEDYLIIIFKPDYWDKIDNGIKVFNDEGKPIDLDSNSFNVSGITDSKLVDMRRFVTYYNDDGVAEIPENGRDWLFYYRKDIAVNIRTINDDLGNVISYSQAQNGNKVASQDKNDLMAYGDIIEDISVDEDEHTIKFTYRIGVHLNANDDPVITTDDDGNQIINWREFVWDEDEKIGIKYEEEYNYEEEGDLDKLINGEFELKDENNQNVGTFTFTDYINGEYDDMLKTFKFEFITINKSFIYEKTIAHQDVNIVSILTDFDVNRNDFDEFVSSPLIREDYLNNITYKPTRNIDVHIERGSTSVFDKHIAFGEIKTMEDMVTYKNGSFFPLNYS